jgi:archaemetzincin
MKNILALLLITYILTACHSKFEKVSKETSIAIQPFEGFESAYSDTVKQTLEDMYGVQVDVLEEIEVPQFAFVNIKSPRYRADTLIRYLRANELYANYDYVIGLIKEDISTTKYEDFKTKKIKTPETKYKDWGIFGLGFCPGKSCVVSSYRLLQSTSKDNFIERLKKVSCHEMGHNFGLPHCPNKDCIMQDAAETIKTIDGVELHLCDDCRKKIGLTN